MGPKLGPQKWVQNCSCNHSCKFHHKSTHTHTHRDTHLQDRRTRIAKLVRQKIFADLKLKTHCCSRNQQQQGQQFTGCEHTDHLHKRFYFSSTRQLSLQACCLWTKMEQQFPKLGGPKTGPQKASKIGPTCWQKERRSSLFYMLGSQIMTPKWAQNWDPKNGFKTAPATTAANSITKAHTHTQRHTFAGQKNKNCKAGPAKNFCRSQVKNPLLQPQPAATRTTIHRLRTHRPPPQEILLQLNTTAVVAGVLSVDKNGAAIP